MRYDACRNRIVKPVSNIDDVEFGRAEIAVDDAPLTAVDGPSNQTGSE